MNDDVTSWITGIKSCRGFNDGENRNAGFLWLNTIPRPKFKLAFVTTIALFQNVHQLDSIQHITCCIDSQHRLLGAFGVHHKFLLHLASPSNRGNDFLICSSPISPKNECVDRISGSTNVCGNIRIELLNQKTSIFSADFPFILPNRLRSSILNSRRLYVHVQHSESSIQLQNQHFLKYFKKLFKCMQQLAKEAD